MRKRLCRLVDRRIYIRTRHYYQLLLYIVLMTDSLWVWTVGIVNFFIHWGLIRNIGSIVVQCSGMRCMVSSLEIGERRTSALQISVVSSCLPSQTHTPRIRLRQPGIQSFLFIVIFVVGGVP
jgi:hypothetical protein